MANRKPTDLEIAFAGFQRQIADVRLPTDAAGPLASPAEVANLALHLTQVFHYYLTYARAVVGNAAVILPLDIQDRLLAEAMTGGMEDGNDEFVAALRNAGETLRRQQREAA